MFVWLFAAMGSAWQPRDEAITAAARHLGYSRTSPQIKATFKSSICRGLIQRDGPQQIRKAR